MRPSREAVLALTLILTGGALARVVQTDFGRVDVRDVRWTGADGARMSGLLYVPDDASATTRAPGVLAIHGYINSRETQSGFAIELARRGFVVLAADQRGHGYSDPPAYAAGFGGPDALAYLRGLDFVDGSRIGLEGHSMGGWAVQVAAAVDPDGYRSMVLEGSSTGTFGAPAGTPTVPRNLAVVFSKYDEFSALMWQTPVARDVAASPKLMALFGTDRPVEVGRVYGSMEEGTARVLHQPPVTHPGDHHSRIAIGHAVEWLSTTLGAPRDLPASDQTWMWKELGTLLGAVGMVWLLLPVGALLLGTSFFTELAAAPTPSRGAKGVGWWIGAVVFTALPAVTLFPFKDVGGRVPASAWLPQSLTTQVVAWALLVGAISLLLFVAWHFASGRRAGAGLEDYGVTWDGRLDARRVTKSLLLALAVVGCAYATLVITAALFTTDFRFWVFAIKPMGALHARIFLSYIVPLTAFFLVYGVVLHGQLRRDDIGPRSSALVAVALSTVGFAALIAYQYAPLLRGGTLAIATESLWSIVAFQFLPIMTIVALMTDFFARRTGRVWVGAFASGLLVTWIVVASQATHFAF